MIMLGEGGVFEFFLQDKKSTPNVVFSFVVSLVLSHLDHIRSNKRPL